MQVRIKEFENRLKAKGPANFAGPLKYLWFVVCQFKTPGFFLFL
jgi:hypothetical protein